MTNLNTKTTLIIASIAVATILVAGALVLPYNYAMAGGSSGNNKHKQSSSSIKITSINIKKSVDAIKQKIQSEAKGGNANGGKGGTSTGGAGGTSTCRQQWSVYRRERRHC